LKLKNAENSKISRVCTPNPERAYSRTYLLIEMSLAYCAQQKTQLCFDPAGPKPTSYGAKIFAQNIHAPSAYAMNTSNSWIGVYISKVISFEIYIHVAFPFVVGLRKS
jgi:hypothetical protein